VSDKIRESISALMDDEISEIELHRLLRQFSGDASKASAESSQGSGQESADQKAIKESWIAFQQIRSISSGESTISVTQHLDLHARISAAIDEEVIETQVETNTSRQWKMPAVGFAVAASLVITVFVGQQVTTDLNPDAGALTSVPNPNVAPSKAIDVQTVSTAASELAGPKALATTFDAGSDQLELQELDAEKQNRLREYLNRHERVTRKNPLARTVVYPPKPTHN
jgi:negative regulator of sigma E activity